MTADRTRLDRWLWAARFYKTRSAATDAVLGGKVTLNDHPAKPAHPVRPGDTICVRVGSFVYDIVVTGLGERRGTAAQAAALYQETDASRAERARHAEMLRLAPSPVFFDGKPSKKDRRTLDRFRGKR